MSGYYIKPCPGVHLYLEVFWHVFAGQVFTGIWQICNNTRRFYTSCHPYVQETATVEPVFVIFKLMLIVCLPFLKSMAWVLRGILLSFCLISSIEVFEGLLKLFMELKTQSWASGFEVPSQWLGPYEVPRHVSACHPHGALHFWPCGSLLIWPGREGLRQGGGEEVSLKG